MKKVYTYFCLVLMATQLSAQTATMKTDSTKTQPQQPDIKEQDVKLFLDKIQVEGKLEKPQAVFVLPGQTPDIDDIQIDRSFFREIFRPVEKQKTYETKYAAPTTKNRKDIIPW